jgi:hypothetical protein
VRPGSEKDQFLAFKPVDQTPVALNMAAPMAFPRTLEGVVVIDRG